MTENDEVLKLPHCGHFSLPFNTYALPFNTYVVRACESCPVTDAKRHLPPTTFDGV